MSRFSSRQRQAMVAILAVVMGAVIGLAHWDDTTTFVVGAVCAAFLGTFGVAFALWPDGRG